MKPIATIRSHRGRFARSFVLACVALVVFLAGLERRASAQISSMPKQLEHVGVTEHLDGQLPLDTPFRDHTGKPVKLGDFFDNKRPTVLIFSYHSCPMLCGMVLNNATEGLKGISWTVGREFDVVDISIDPEETLEHTANKRTSIIAEYGRAGSDSGWHFLVANPGDKAAIAKVAAAAGFEYEYDPEIKQWGHPSLVMITKPDGRMARYLYGLEFSSPDLKLGLLEASAGRSISTVEQIILYCYHYDPQGGKYVLVAQRVMQVGGGAVGIVLFGFLGLFWLRELRKSKQKQNHEDDDKTSPPSKRPVDVTV